MSKDKSTLVKRRWLPSEQAHPTPNRKCQAIGDSGTVVSPKPTV